MTQTTQDRIIARMRSVIRCIEMGVHSESAIIDGLFEVGVEIAAEITDLQEKNAFLLTSAETAQAKLAEARAEVDAVRFAAHMPDDYAYGLPSWINQRLYANYIGADISPHVMAMIEGGTLTFPGSPAEKALAEARAEVARLRDHIGFDQGAPA